MRHPRRLVPLLFVVLALLAVGAANAPFGGESSAPPADAPAADPYSVLGPSRIDGPGLVAAYRASGHTPRLTVPLEDLAQMFVEEGAAYGVRGDIAFAQSLVETAWLKFPDYGQVLWTDNNFAGIGAYDGGAHGFPYPDARTGVRAQIQLLRQYADPEPMPDAITKTHKRGAAPSWRDMGNGNWATSTTYAEKVIAVYDRLLADAGVTLADVADVDATPEPEIVPVLNPGDGMWLAGADGHVYDVGDTRFWGSAGGTVADESVVAIAAMPDGSGYWLFGRAGGVLGYGAAPDLGDARDRATQPVAAAVATASGLGYWTVGTGGELLAFGDAPPLAATGGVFPPGARVAAAARTPGGGGLWLVDSAGHVVTLGDAAHHGDLTGREADPRDPVVALAPMPAGDGYWMVTGAGVVTAFGTAPDDLGSPVEDALDALRRGEPLPTDRLVVGLVAAASGGGYWVVTADGHVEGYGDAFDMGTAPLAGAPVLAVTGREPVRAS